MSKIQKLSTFQRFMNRKIKYYLVVIVYVKEKLILN